VQQIRKVTTAIIEQAGREKIGNWRVPQIDIPTRA